MTSSAFPIRAFGFAIAGQLLAVSTLALAQTSPPPEASPSPAAPGADVVWLKDGTQLTGTVLDQKPGEFVVLRTLDGRELTLSWEEVRRVERGSSAPANPAAPPAPAPGQPPPAAQPVAPAPPPPSPAPTPQGPAPIAPQPLGVSAEVTFEEAEARRRAWLAKGGSIVGYELRGYGMFVLLPPVTMKFGNHIFSPTGGVTSVPEDREERGIGGGGGAGFRIAFMNMSLPDPSAGNTWTALRIASGLDFGYAYIGFPTQTVAVRTFQGGSVATTYDTEYKGTSLLMLNLPIQLGGMIGLGSFDGAEWRGIALSASWAPSYNYVKPGEGDGDGSFNYTGFEVSVDFLDANGPLEASAPRAHGKVFAFVLPPVGDLPLVATIGGGAVWY